MLGTKPPTELESRLEWWGRQIARQQSSGLSVAEFCRQAGITVRKFSYWRDRVRAVVQADPRRGATDRSPREPSAGHGPGAGATSFLPVSILDTDATTQLEVELSNACIVRLRGVIDPHLLQAAILAAGQLDGSHQGAD